MLILLLQNIRHKFGKMFDWKHERMKGIEGQVDNLGVCVGGGGGGDTHS